jgi:hypothetical protein
MRERVPRLIGSHWVPGNMCRWRNSVYRFSRREASGARKTAKQNKGVHSGSRNHTFAYHVRLFNQAVPAREMFTKADSAFLAGNDSCAGGSRFPIGECIEYRQNALYYDIGLCDGRLKAAARAPERLSRVAGKNRRAALTICPRSSALGKAGSCVAGTAPSSFARGFSG